MTDFYIRQGDTASDLADVLRDANGDPVNIQGATVRFLMVPLRGGTAKIDDDAQNDQVGDGLGDGSRGKVRYVWENATQTDTPGDYLGSWVVTFSGGKVQTYPNGGYLLITVTPDAPTEPGSYLLVEELKHALTMQNQTYADEEMKIAIAAAGRGLEANYGGPWGEGAADEARFFTPMHGLTYVRIGALSEVTEVALDEAGGGSYNRVLVEGVDYRLEPVGNGPAPGGSGEPWQRLRFLRAGSAWSWQYDPRVSPYPWGFDSLRITGTWGYSTTPPGVKAASLIVATRLLRRMRDAPFGIIGLGMDGAAVRAGQIAKDPEVVFAMTGAAPRKRLLV